MTPHPETGEFGATDFVCPRCGDRSEQAAAVCVGPEVGPLPRCPAHGLAYVPASEVDPENPDPMLGRCVAERFTVLGKLGTGAMGAVYRARQEAIGRDVALKILRSERMGDANAQARFEREARATSALVSPHTITVFDFGAAADGSWFLAMELLKGETLGARLRRQSRVPPNDACRIIREALKSLAEAHAKGIIHRDMKPDNLFLVTIPDEGGTLSSEVCKLLDFGIAKVVGPSPNVDQLETQAGAVFGTPRYMSPEQAQGTQLDARSDLYSLSVILYAMLTGRAPFIDDDAVVVMASHIMRQPPSFREAAPDLEPLPALEALVMRGLAKSPAARPQCAEDFISLLDEAAGELDVPPSRRLRWSRSWRVVHRWHRSSLLRRGVAVGLVAFLVAGAVAALGGHQPAGRRSTATLDRYSRQLAALARDYSARAYAPPQRLPEAPSASAQRPADNPNPARATPERTFTGASKAARKASGGKYGRFE